MQERTWFDSRVERFRAHPEEMQSYLELSLEDAESDGFWGGFMVALSIFVEVHGGIVAVAGRMNVPPREIEALLNSDQPPRFDLLSSLLRQLGLRLSFPSAMAKAS